MSKREAADGTRHNLQTAEKWLQAAEQAASGTGDATLQKTVKRLREETATTHQEITKKMGSEGG